MEIMENVYLKLNQIPGAAGKIVQGKIDGVLIQNIGYQFKIT